jgi:hypothetical protein
VTRGRDEGFNRELFRQAGPAENGVRLFIADPDPANLRRYKKDDRKTGHKYPLLSVQSKMLIRQERLICREHCKTERDPQTLI